MQVRINGFIFLALFLFAACANKAPKPYSSASEIINRLNSVSNNSGIAIAYLDVAIGLQSLKATDAQNVLYQLAKASDSRVISDLPPFRYEQIHILCRILFKAKLGKSFNKPSRGSESYLMPPPAQGFPLHPIVISEGVPFLIPMVVTITGATPVAKEYLDYCIQECDWNDFRYKQKTPAELKQALTSLINSIEQKSEISDQLKNNLASQIE